MPALGNALGLPFRKNGLGFVGALDAVASMWFWEDSVQMEWESGIGIISE